MIDQPKNFYHFIENETLRQILIPTRNQTSAKHKLHCPYESSICDLNYKLMNRNNYSSLFKYKTGNTEESLE